MVRISYQFLYMKKSEIDKKNLKYQHYYRKNDQEDWTTRTITVKGVNNPKGEENYQLSSLTPYSGNQVKLVSDKQYRQIKAKKTASKFIIGQ